MESNRRPRWILISLPQLARRHGPAVVFGAFALVSTAISILIIGMVAHIAGVPLVFPSLGPTAFLIFDQPRVGAASPRNALIGHALGILGGVVALYVTGTRNAPPVLSATLPAHRVAAIAVALGLTSGAMAVLRMPHPPAAATTLIVSLGFLTRLPDLLAFYAGVIALVGQGFVIDRLSGLRYPSWTPLAAATGDDAGPIRGTPQDDGPPA